MGTACHMELRTDNRRSHSGVNHLYQSPIKLHGPVSRVCIDASLLHG